jgi:hypothetical protein
MQKVLVVRLRDEAWNGNLVESRSPAEVSVAGRKSQLAIADRLYVVNRDYGDEGGDRDWPPAKVWGDTRAFARRSW